MTIGREPVTVVELDQDLCQLTYGVAPCAAALGVTGPRKCFNTIASCQDEDNYSLGDPLTLRFVTPNEWHGLPRTLLLIPSLVSVGTTPTRINLASGNPDASPLGERGTIEVVLMDHPYHDRVTDPYVTERDYDPAGQGTFWARWLARNPYHAGRGLRVRTGFVGQALSEFSMRHYVIDRIDGPSVGQVTITAKDPLRLLDDTRVRAPAVNTGTLDQDISDEDTSPLQFDLLPAGIGDEEYDAAGVARIGGELVQFVRGGDTVDIVSRGLRGTDISSHSEGDVFQQVLVITSQRVDALLSTLMVDYGGIDPDWVPTDDWDAEADLWCSGFNLSAWITEPTGVGSLVAQVCEETGVYVWWDESAQVVRLRATRPFYPARDTAAQELNHAQHVVEDSLTIDSLPEERITQVWMYYVVRNPAGSLDDPSNFARLRVLADNNAEAAVRYGDQRIKVMYCRFLDESNDSTTAVVAARILDRRHESPRVLTWHIDHKDASVNLGEIVRLTHPDLSDIYGAAEPTFLHITSVDPIDPGHLIEVEARPYITRTRYAFIMADGSPDYSAATTAQRESGGWVAPDVLFANGDNAYRVL